MDVTIFVLLGDTSFQSWFDHSKFRGVPTCNVMGLADHKGAFAPEIMILYSRLTRNMLRWLLRHSIQVMVLASDAIPIIMLMGLQRVHLLATAAG